MKKFALVLIVLALVAGSSTVFAAGQNLEQQAIAAAKAAGCITSTKNLEVQAEVANACFYTGYITNVYIYYVPYTCKPNQELCPKPAVQLVATVQFGCDNEVASVTCN